MLQQLAIIEGVTWPAKILFPSDTAPLINGVRVAYPKNLSLRFGAHRASVYGSSATTKNAAFNAAAKDLGRKAHALEFMARPVLPWIMYEDFADYETLMADMAEDPTPLTFPCIPEITPESPRSVAQKRTRGLPVAGDGTTRGGPPARGASDSAAGGTATGAGNTATMAQRNTPATTVLTRTEQIAAFVASPMMP